MSVAPFEPLGHKNVSHLRPAALDRFWFGAAYYPEHWDAATRASDARLMQEAGMNVVRMGEFAWDRLEPEPGRHDFSLFDQTIAELGARGIKTLFCTPTAAPPRWLTVQHPEVLRVDAHGKSMVHGSRQHACTTSPVLRGFSHGITQALAAHYKSNPHVVGWQTDNEFNCGFSECHCAACQAAFRAFLRRKFDNDLAALNDAWGTAFWAQTYTSFDQIATPRPSHPGGPNPAQQLDYYRFISDSVARFQHDQVEILRRTNPRWFVFHNVMTPHVDLRGPFTQDLDVLGYDVYPMFTEDPAARPQAQAFALDRMRAWSGNLIVPEHQSGPGGFASRMLDTPEPGEIRQQSLRSIAHGADGLLYFRWRTARFGAEQYWMGILDHDNVPRRRYHEIQALGRELAAIGPALLGTRVHVDAAVAAADQLVSDSHASYPLGLPSPDDVARDVHAALFRAGFAAGCVHPCDALDHLRLYVIPHWAYFDPAWLPKLEHFVERGGTLVIGARSATRDTDNNIVARTPPGVLADLAGARVREFGRQNRPDLRPLAIEFGGAATPTELWYEALEPEPGSEVFGLWRGRHLEGACAISLRAVGRGRVYYVGSYLTPKLIAGLLPYLIESSGLTRTWPDAPLGIEVIRRESPTRNLWFFLNASDHALTVDTTPRGTNLLTGTLTGPRSEITLERYGVAVIEEG